MAIVTPSWRQSFTKKHQNKNTMVWLVVTHSVLELRSEKQFEPSLTIQEVKQKLYAIVGTEPNFMNLQLFAREEDEQATVSSLENSKTLQEYGVRDHMRIHVIDQDPSNKMQSFDDEEVEKYVMSEEDYDKRENTFRKWKQRNIDPFVSKTKSEPTGEEAKYANPSIVEGIEKDNRCELKESKVRGQVKFVGKVSFAKGYWVGVQLDEPSGTCDGSVKGKRYFTCPATQGIFIRPDQINVGDYPEESFDFDEF